MPSITINKATIREAKTLYDERTSSAFVRVHICGEMTKSLAKQLKCEKTWDSMDERKNMSKLLGELRLVKFSHTPNDKDLAKNGIAFTAQSADSFAVSNGKKEGPPKIEFNVITGEDIASVVFGYHKVVGHCEAKCVLTTQRGEQSLFTENQQQEE